MTRYERRELAKGLLALLILIIVCGLIGPYKMPIERPQYVVNDGFQRHAEALAWARHYEAQP